MGMGKSTGTGWDGKKFMGMELEWEQFILLCHCLLWNRAAQLAKHSLQL